MMSSTKLMLDRVTLTMTFTSAYHDLSRDKVNQNKNLACPRMCNSYLSHGL